MNCCHPKSSLPAGQLPPNLPLELRSSSSIGQKRLLAKELYGLTVEEREQVYDEVHGVSKVVYESPDFVAAKLVAMREELEKIPKRDRKALDRARFLRPSLQNDDKFHLLFLRAARFDPVNAAGWMARHFEHKLVLFGDQLLPARITIDDLGEREIALLHSGAFLLLNSLDQGGRGVWLLTVSQCDFNDGEAFMRAAWYRVMSALEDDEEIQKRGVVQVVNFYGHGEWKQTPAQVIDFVWHWVHIVRDWPFRSLGFHLCYDQPALRSLVECLSIVVGKELRIRERCHFGSKMETEYALISFGIRTAGWFTPGEGMMSTNNLVSIVDDRRRREAKWRRLESLDTKFIKYPRKQMVLMGRGMPYREWIGNLELYKRISVRTDRYMGKDIDRVDKAMIAMEIVQVIQIDGGRFIRRTDEGWETVDDLVSKAKVSQALRAEVRRRNSGKGKGESCVSGSPASPPSNIEAQLPQQKRHRIG